MNSCLDFEVQPRSVFYSSAGPWSAGINKAEKKVALVRKDTNECLTIVSDRYQIIQNEEYFPLIDEAVETYFSKDSLQINDRISYGGRFSSREYIVKDVKGDIPIQHGDTTLRLYARNSHGAGSLKLFSGLVDCLCANLELWKFNNQETHTLFLRHTRKAKDEIAERAIFAIEEGVRMFHEKNATYAKWATTPVEKEAAMTYLDETFSPRAAAEVKSFYETEEERRGATLWALASAMTGYATHGRFRGGERAKENTMFQRQQQIAALLAVGFSQLGSNRRPA